ncbi:MAG: hypothetical protein OEQ53_21610 [Saprospiraceae bacterium]|nr:hypothetical protein [Saprospiraceae bacterium]
MKGIKVLVSQTERLPFISDRSISFQRTYLPSEADRYDQTQQLLADYDALLAINVRVDQGLLKNAHHLKIISNFGVGYDNVDMEIANKHGLVVTNTPTSTSKPTAVFTIAVMLSLLRRVTATDRWLRSGQITSFNDPVILGTSVHGKTLGIIGMGRIGKEVARLAQSLGMRLIYYNRSRLLDEEFDVPSCEYVSLDALFRRADVITIHTPLTSETRSLIDGTALKSMKPTAYLLNTARGGVVDYEALEKSLLNGQIAGAAIDVFPNEPNIPTGLRNMENVVLTPHNGTGTMEARQSMFEEAMQNIINFFEGKNISRVL